MVALGLQLLVCVCSAASAATACKYYTGVFMLAAGSAAGCAEHHSTALVLRLAVKHTGSWSYRLCLYMFCLGAVAHSMAPPAHSFGPGMAATMCYQNHAIGFLCLACCAVVQSSETCSVVKQKGSGAFLGWPLAASAAWDSYSLFLVYLSQYVSMQCRQHLVEQGQVIGPGCDAHE